MTSKTKILTIIGSPRKKGNSYQAAKKLEEMMKVKVDYEFEYLFLKDINLEACKAVLTVYPKELNTVH